ncbi:MAG: SDR family oxidoreductase, partial [Bacteroidia bacterium]|nr:SDR family oxidoreductase [Bacteroidia bacterium]
MKTFLVIGASSGIGNSIARQLASSGHQVIGTYNNTDSTDQSNIQFHKLDVNSYDNTEFIGEKLDGLVYCPGSINLMPFHRIKPEQFLADFNLQVLGAIKMIQASLPSLKKSKASSIVLFSTVAVQKGFNFHTQVSVSKGAIEGLTRALAAELS